MHTETPASIRNLLQLFVLEPQPVALLSSFLLIQNVPLLHWLLVVIPSSNVHPLGSSFIARKSINKKTFLVYEMDHSYYIHR